MVSVQGHFDPEQRGLEVRGVHLHADFFEWYILLFQPRFAESRDAGLWMHGEPGIRRADCGYVWGCCSTHVVQGSTVLLIPATPWVVQWPGLLQRIQTALQPPGMWGPSSEMELRSTSVSVLETLMLSLRPGPEGP